MENGDAEGGQGKNDLKKLKKNIKFNKKR